MYASDLETLIKFLSYLLKLTCKTSLNPYSFKKKKRKKKKKKKKKKKN